MSKRLESNLLVTESLVDQIPVDSERIFAQGWLIYFGLRESLIYHPPAITAPGVGTSAVDFLHHGMCMNLYFEITKTLDTWGNVDKEMQYKVREAHRKNHPNDRHLEINGASLANPTWLYPLLGQVIQGYEYIPAAQAKINHAGSTEKIKQRNNLYLNANVLIWQQS